MTEQRLHAALVTAQATFRNPPKTKTAKGGAYSYTFASLPEILDLVRPILAECGLAVVQSVSAMDGLVGVKTIIIHTSGESLESSVLWLPAGETPQQSGSAISYARRYSLCAMLGIAADEDNDAPDVSPKRKRSLPASTTETGQPADVTEVMVGTGEGPTSPGASAGDTSEPPEIPGGEPSEDGSSAPDAEYGGSDGSKRRRECLHTEGVETIKNARGELVDVCKSCRRPIGVRA